MGPWCGSDALVPSAKAFVTVRPGERIGEVQRALHQSGARVALVIEDSAKRPEVQGIITERELTKMACAAASIDRLSLSCTRAAAHRRWPSAPQMD